jgi:hypothetical protein
MHPIQTTVGDYARPTGLLYQSAYPGFRTAPWQRGLDWNVPGTDSYTAANHSFGIRRCATS